MSEPRYFVDERAGCIAVRDRTLTDPEYPGLHSYTEGVVKYWHGIVGPSQTCSMCGHQVRGPWMLKPEDVKAANELCDSLNATVEATP